MMNLKTGGKTMEAVSSSATVGRGIRPYSRIKHALWCLFGKHVWRRPMFIRLNSLPGDEDFECHFCGKHKTFFNRKETILFMPNAGSAKP